MLYLNSSSSRWWQYFYLLPRPWEKGHFTPKNGYCAVWLAPYCKYLNTWHKLILRNLYRSGYKKWYLSRFWFWKIAIKRVLLLREFEKISFLWLVSFFNSFDWREFNKRFGKNRGRTNFYLLCISKLQFTSVLGSQVKLNAEPMLSFYYVKAPMLWL